MPTGYTEKIKDGITFKQFALNCSRAFGALVSMRDDPMDKEIPTNLKFESFHEKSLEEAVKKREELLNMTPEQIIKSLEKEASYQKQYCIKQIEEKKELKIKYENMIREVENYTPPSQDHVEFKKFMLDQLTNSLKWDCDIEYHEKELQKLQTVSVQQWIKHEIEIAEDIIKYHKKELEQDRENFKNRNLWITNLHKSLKDYK